MSRPTCISLFSGAGGLDLGLEASGFETLVATDIDFHSCRTLEANKARARALRKPFLRQAAIVEADATKLQGRDLLSQAGLKPGDLDLLAGGPPCQAFSVFGLRKGKDDPRGQLSFHYLRLLSEMAPQAFLFENVFGLLTIDGGRVFSELLEKLEHPKRGLRYDVSVHRLNAVDFGVPQFRDRVFIIGTRTGSPVRPIEGNFSQYPDLLSDKLPWRTVRDALRGLPRMGTGGLENHTGRNHSERIIDRYRSMAHGERDAFTRINKLDPDRPSFTIIVGSDKGGGKGHIHPTLPREVTPRESARIQCFPDWWGFSGTSRHPIRQVGNAVPSLLGYAVGAAILEQTLEREANSMAHAVDLLSQDHMFSQEDLRFLRAYARAS